MWGSKCGDELIIRESYAPKQGNPQETHTGDKLYTLLGRTKPKHCAPGLLRFVLILSPLIVNHCNIQRT